MFVAINDIYNQSDRYFVFYYIKYSVHSEAEFCIIIL